MVNKFLVVDLILFYIMESAIAAPVPPSLTIASTTAAFCCWFREGRERERGKREEQ